MEGAHPPFLTAVPTPSQSPDTLEQTLQGMTTAASVSALKKLVARLQREQKKVQDLLSSLSFSLRSFNNLNQFLALIPLIVT